MKKMFTLMILGLFVISMLGAVSGYTVVAGKIYNKDYSYGITGANITVECYNGALLTGTNYTTSLNNGSYAVQFKETGDNKCAVGYDVIVTASKDHLLGVSDRTEVEEYPGVSINLAIVNVPMTPEFGFIFGMVTFLSSVGLFFIIRK